MTTSFGIYFCVFLKLMTTSFGIYFCVFLLHFSFILPWQKGTNSIVFYYSFLIFRSNLEFFFSFCDFMIRFKEHNFMFTSPCLLARMGDVTLLRLIFNSVGYILLWQKGTSSIVFYYSFLIFRSNSSFPYLM